MGSTNSRQLDRIAGALAPQLDDLGFVRDERSFVRKAPDRVRQTVELQIGIKAMAGRFTVNLWVTFPEVKRLLDYDRNVQMRPLKRGHRGKDVWLDLDEDTERLVARVAMAVRDPGERFFASLGSRDGFLRSWRDNSIPGSARGRPHRANPPRSGPLLTSGLLEAGEVFAHEEDKLARRSRYVGDVDFGPTAPVVAAVLLRAQRRIPEATAVLAEAYRWASEYHPGHAEVLLDWARRMRLRIEK